MALPTAATPAGTGCDRAGAAMNYCILRAEKLTSFGSIAGSAKHTFREIPTLNADASRTHLNKTYGAQNSAAVRAAIEVKLPAKRRKDAVLCIEYLITASPEWFDTASTKQKNDYFKDAATWLHARHGKENVVCLNMQHDEKSPHLVAYVAPMTSDGRLSAKDFLGGRKVLSQMQTDFADKAGKPVGLQRGIEGSKATHITAKQYAATLQKNPTLVPPTAPTPTIADWISGNAREMEAEYTAKQAAYLALVEQARNVAEISRQARVAQAAALAQVREDTEKGNQRTAEADRLREENRLLERRLQQQRTYFQQQIDDLKEALAKAVDQVKQYATKIGLVTGQRDQAEAEAEEMRAVLYPHEQQSRAAPY